MMTKNKCLSDNDIKKLSANAKHYLFEAFKNDACCKEPSSKELKEGFSELRGLGLALVSMSLFKNIPSVTSKHMLTHTGKLAAKQLLYMMYEKALEMLAQEENDTTEALKERDEIMDKTNDLLAAIEDKFSVHFGFHSNMNCPIDKAINFIETEAGNE